MDKQSKINRGLSRAGRAEQSRQDSTQRIENKRVHSLDQTLGLDARLQCYGTKMSPQQIEQIYTQPQPPQQ